MSGVGSWGRTRRVILSAGCSAGVTQGARVLLLLPNASFVEARLFLQHSHAWVLPSPEHGCKLRTVSGIKESRGHPNTL